MGKTKKSAKEIERLRELYKGEGRIGEAKTVGDNGAPATVASGHPVHAQSFVRRDLAALSIIIVVFAILLFAINYMASSTAFGEVLGSWVSKIV